MTNVANQAIGAAVGAGIFSGPQCAQVAAAMDSLKPLSPLWEAMDQQERLSALDITQFIATGQVQLLAYGTKSDSRWIQPFKTLDANSVDWNAVLKRMNGLSDEMVALLKSPTIKDELAAQRKFDRKMTAIKAKQTGQTSLAKRGGETTDAYSQRIADAIIAVCVPSIARAENSYRRCMIQEKLTRAVVAAGQYRAEKGKWPDRLEDLTPEYLPVALNTTLTALQIEPVRYQHGDAGISLHAREVWNEADPNSLDISAGVK
jgi:hypothetical protein